MQETARIIDQLKEMKVWDKLVNTGILKKSAITKYKAQKAYTRHRDSGLRKMDAVVAAADEVGITPEYTHKLVDRE